MDRHFRQVDAEEATSALGINDMVVAFEYDLAGLWVDNLFGRLAQYNVSHDLDGMAAGAGTVDATNRLVQ